MTERKKKLLKIESSVHHPNGTRKISETEAGPIYRVPLKKENNLIYPRVQIPDYFSKVTRTQRNRNRFMTTMNYNSRIGPRWLGKPNSAFFLCDDEGDGYFIDYLQESLDHNRNQGSNLHEIIRSNIDYKDCKLCPGISVLSGHFAPLNITTPDIAYLMTFDAYAGGEAFKDLPNQMKHGVLSMYKSRIIPMTADGFIISK